MGMLPSASLGPATAGGRNVGLYEPVHGTAPDIAGKGVANPLAAILSAGLLLRYSLNMTDAPAWVEATVQPVLEQGRRTGDIAKPGEQGLGTTQMSDTVVHQLDRCSLRRSRTWW